jgi:hypothetical protein
MASRNLTMPTSNLTQTTTLAALLVATIRQLSATRAAYHVAVNMLHQRGRQLAAAEGKYLNLLDEHRRLRADDRRRAA